MDGWMDGWIEERWIDDGMDGQTMAVSCKPFATINRSTINNELHQPLQLICLIQ